MDRKLVVIKLVLKYNNTSTTHTTHSVKCFSYSDIFFVSVFVVILLIETNYLKVTVSIVSF